MKSRKIGQIKRPCCCWKPLCIMVMTGRRLPSCQLWLVRRLQNLPSKVNDTTASGRWGNGSLERQTRHESEISSNGDTNQNALKRANADVNSQIDKEEQDIEGAMTSITEVQMRDIQDKILHFEEMDLVVEKEMQQLESMRNLGMVIYIFLCK